MEDIIPISFFWVQAAPGNGPSLHKHPYEEIFVILEGNTPCFASLLVRLCAILRRIGCLPKHPMAQEGCYAQIIIACVHLVGEVPAL
jgi:hypothetical protein